MEKPWESVSKSMSEINMNRLMNFILHSLENENHCRPSKLQIVALTKSATLPGQSFKEVNECHKLTVHKK
jgi:hypothetical protein